VTLAPESGGESRSRHWLGSGTVVLTIVLALLLMLAGSVMVIEPRQWHRAAGSVPAFPGAEGFGAETPGGRGGRVISVTNLDDSGPGSFREAVTTPGPRIVVFRVSGTINLETDIDITSPYITIAGQTSPAGGITLKADSCNGRGVLGVHTHDVVIRYLRLRPGPHPCYGDGDSSDGIVVYKPGTYRVVIDHSSISWAVDENVSLWSDAHDITFSWNIISEGLAHSTHKLGEHSKGAHLSGWNTYNISFHHNLLAHNNDRNPQPTNPGIADIRNNVVYNYGEHAALASSSKGRPRFNFVGNYYRPGPDSDRDQYVLDVYRGSSAGWASSSRATSGRVAAGTPSRRRTPSTRPVAPRWSDGPSRRRRSPQPRRRPPTGRCSPGRARVSPTATPSTCASCATCGTRPAGSSTTPGWSADGPSFPAGAPRRTRTVTVCRTRGSEPTTLTRVSTTPPGTGTRTATRTSKST
jgi:pectate lyase